MTNKIQFTKIRNVKSPNRAHSTDAGSDWFVPNLDDQFIKDLKAKNKENKLRYQLAIDEQGDEILEIEIPSGEQVNIPSGIKVNILDKNTYLQATNKSGIASKYHLDVMANTIDADYQGECHLNVVNTGNTKVIVRTGMKLLQMIHKEFINTEWEEISNEEYSNISKSARGEGGFNSTGLK